MTRLLVHGAVLLTVDPSRPDPFVGWFTVGDDGRISALEPGEPPEGLVAEQVLDASGTIIGPGFVSSHSHLFTSGCRGLGMDQSLYGWIEAMTAPLAGAVDEDIYWMTRHGAQDFLRNGITTAFDFTSAGLSFEKESDGVARYAASLPDAVFQHAQLRGKVDAGLRSVHSVMLGQGAVDHAAALAHLDDVVSLATDVDRSLLLGVALSGTVQWAESPDAATLEVAAMRRHGLLNQPHFLETPHEISLQQAKFAWYREAGALGPDLVFGHFIQTTDEILVEAAAAGCGMSWQPMSNGRLASGVASIPRIRELGMRVGIGLDDQSCTDVSDPFANMRTALSLVRATYHDPAALPVRDVLELHTRGSAEVLGIDREVGSLRVGRFADFLVVDPRRPDTGPVWDAYGTYVLACSLRNLRQVWSGGRLVAEGVALCDPQADEVESQLHERLGRLQGVRA
ncbi:cytosine/adenosine deaminase-related metal-dependent hydrolase [Motilibacter rhizosphaerae]|uniref:Cytosine/adenosine deaminase-related metal-dependent hydrolase n=1 Tax=Motilibacter rhizosphaerae TaxID=598652 RepID=A0A4Q7NFL2_9ACTN|nr:amidohydrolase family protein [Motilibacter rhizosphaerae]RZS82681.1 cytosine/adenosine deaminase-related metal-dependent hydrolase [Motilibacter rhizosphaerae]